MQRIANGFEWVHGQSVEPPAVAETPVKMRGHVPSKYQAAIFDWVRHGSGNAVVDAVAGSGKTSTIVDALDVIPSDASVLFLAFNRHIAAELKSRVPANVRVATLNSFGWGSVMCRCPTAVLDAKKTAKVLKYRVFGLHPESVDEMPASTQDGKIVWPNVELSDDASELVKAYQAVPAKLRRKLWREQRAVYDRIVGLLKATGAANASDWQSVAVSYGADLGTVEPDSMGLILSPLYESIVENLSIFDFDDQCFAPVYHGWNTRRFDWVIGDEIQDWTATQTRLAMKAIDPDGGRFLGVGDPSQSIYMFRGSDINSIPNIIEATGADVLPLSVCYRCPASVVAEAARYVKHIEPSPGAKTGMVDRIKHEAFESEVEPGNYVLCRTTAPLVEACLEQLRRGKPAVVKGRDLGQSLIALTERIAGNGSDDEPNLAMPIEAFIGRLRDWRDGQVEKLTEAEKEEEIARVVDQAETLFVFADGPNTVGEMTARIKGLFRDDSETGRIVFATVHRSKGLQAPTVYVLRPDLMPHPASKSAESRQQERNLKYVAITRAQDRLVWVESERLERQVDEAIKRHRDKQTTMFGD